MATKEGSDNFNLLHPDVQRWVWLQGWDTLKPIQQNAIPPIIAENTDVILGAPTAGGKTEAAFLPILSRLKETPVESGFSVLYISPLKALINDQGMRLEMMAGAMGIDVTPWHGDVDMAKKQRSLQRPSGILVITPESLESLFVNRPHSLEKAFGNLRYIVIDELHAFMGSERGKQLQSLMSRIEHLIGRRVPRIAMSATFANYTGAMEQLRPGHDYPCCVPDAGGETHDTKILIKEYIASPDCDANREIAEDIFHHMRGTNNLVFTNARKEAETLTLTLRDMSEKEHVPNEFHVHHGSLGKLEREGVEKALKKGTIPVTAICTSTMELGIDIGKVKSVAQIGTVNSISGMRQRLGRSGRRGEPSILRIYSVDEQRDDYKYHLRTNLVQNIAAVELMRKGIYESPNIQNPHFSVLVQQVLSLLAQYGSFYPRNAYRLLCTEGAFRNVSAQEFLSLLSHLGQKKIVTMTDSGQIVIGVEGERMVKKIDFYTSFITLKDWNVINKSTGKVIGSIQYKPYVGEYFLLAGVRWLVETIDDRGCNVFVNAAATTGKLMFEGFGSEIDGLITFKMRDIYMSDEKFPYLDASLGTADELELARQYFRSIGLDKKDFMEIGGKSIYFTWKGMKHNRFLSLLLSDKRSSIPSFDPWAIEDVTPSDLTLLRSNSPALDPLLEKRISRSKKENYKYDHLLPSPLLNRQFRTSHLQY